MRSIAPRSIHSRAHFYTNLPPLTARSYIPNLHAPAALPLTFSQPSNLFGIMPQRVRRETQKIFTRALILSRISRGGITCKGIPMETKPRVLRWKGLATHSLIAFIHKELLKIIGTLNAHKFGAKGITRRPRCIAIAPTRRLYIPLIPHRG